MYYRSLPGKCPWAFFRTQYLHTWALTRDRKRILSYGSIFSHPCKIGIWALTREWALTLEWTLTWDTTVSPLPIIFMDNACLLTHLQLDT